MKLSRIAGGVFLCFLLTFIALGISCSGNDTLREEGGPVTDLSPDYLEITGQELLERLEAGDEMRLIDVREEYEYNEGHIPGAELFPLDQLKENYQELDPREEIILICRSGNRSGQAAAFLKEQGYDMVYNLVGGMLDWPGEVVIAP